MPENITKIQPPQKKIPLLFLNLDRSVYETWLQIK